MALLGFLLLAGMSGPAPGRTIVTCEDAGGERFFSARCPTGTKQVDSREVSTGAPASAQAPATATADAPADDQKDGIRRLREVVAYVAPDCVPCDFLQRHLQNRRVAFRTVDVEADPASFEAVKGRLDTVGVPVLTIGDELLTGFQPKRIDQTLVTEGVLLATDVPDYEPPPAPPPIPPAPPQDPEQRSPAPEVPAVRPGSGAE